MSTTIDSSGDPSAAVSGPPPPAESESPAAGSTQAPRLSKEETARLGDEIYERDVRPQVEEAHRGDYVSIDVDSGAWAMADDIRAAAASLRAEHPQAVNVWTVRVGYRAIQHFGGRPLRPTDAERRSILDELTAEAQRLGLDY